MRRPLRNRPGFTLVELLVVIVIIILVSAAALPTILPALNSRQVSEGARILQAALAGARDAAIRANAPRGIRLLPDTTLSGSVQAADGALAGGQMLTCSRIVPIEPAPDLTDSSLNGSATFHTANASWNASLNGSNSNSGQPNPPAFPFPPNYLPTTARARGFYPFADTNLGTTPALNTKVLMVVQAVYQGNGVNGKVPNPPTNWFWNVRIGDKFRFADSGRYYTVVGPLTVANPESFVNDGPSDSSAYGPNYPSLIDVYGPVGSQITVQPEYLFLVNGVDDDGDGFIDNGVDGVNQNCNVNTSTGEPYPDLNLLPGNTEWSETEKWLGSQALVAPAIENSANIFPPTLEWVITRRPVPSPGAREVSLPGGATIDLTTWDTSQERSRLPVNPFNGTVDVLINQAGQVVPTTYYSSPSSYSMAGAFMHFWVADRGDVVAPTGTSAPRLPLSSDALNPPATAPTVFLKKDRVLVTLFTKSGQIVSNSVENFDYTDVNRPFDEAQLGTREAK